MPIKVLIVEDDKPIATLLTYNLEAEGYAVAHVVSGADAMPVIEKFEPDLVILDWALPDVPGIEICRQVRARLDIKNLPIIMLTAVGDEDTVLEGLERHAEDYIVKPFSSGELIARVSRILGRMGRMNFASTPLTYVDEQLQINFPDREALVNEVPGALTPTETRLLYILMRQAGETVTTDYILRRLWPGEPAFEDRLHVHLHRLRRKLEGEESEMPREYIMSERGKGYLFDPHAGEIAS